MTKQPPGFSPGQLAMDLGLVHSSWHLMGDGPWNGTITHDGLEWEIEELSTSWRATSSAAQVLVGSSLEQLLKRMLGR